MKLLFCLLLVLVTSACSTSQLPPGNRDGQVHVISKTQFVAWDDENHEWLSPEQFWRQFSERRRGKIWPADTKFPPYSQVNEHDTLLLNLDSGPCLMYFFHTRWRRANDVWRWGDEFNRYGGCHKVFDD